MVNSNLFQKHDFGFPKGVSRGAGGSCWRPVELCLCVGRFPEGRVPRRRRVVLVIGRACPFSISKRLRFRWKMKFFFVRSTPHPPGVMKRTNGGVPVDTAARAAEWCLEYHRIVACYNHTNDARQIAVLDQQVINMIQDKITRFSDMV